MNKSKLKGRKILEEQETELGRLRHKKNDYYEILGVDFNASSGQIEFAYQAKKKYLILAKDEMFFLVQEAYCVLSHSRLRWLYNKIFPWERRRRTFANFIGSQFSSFSLQLQFAPGGWITKELIFFPIPYCHIVRLQNEVRLTTHCLFNKKNKREVKKCLIERFLHETSRIIEDVRHSIHIISRNFITRINESDNVGNEYNKRLEALFFSELVRENIHLVSSFKALEWKRDKENLIGAREFSELRTFRKFFYDHLMPGGIIENSFFQQIQKKDSLKFLHLSYSPIKYKGSFFRFSYFVSPTLRCCVINNEIPQKSVLRLEEVFNRIISSEEVNQLSYGEWESCYNLRKKIDLDRKFISSSRQFDPTPYPLSCEEIFQFTACFFFTLGLYLIGGCSLLRFVFGL